jgi:hypothetical protein
MYIQANCGMAGLSSEAQHSAVVFVLSCDLSDVPLNQILKPLHWHQRTNGASLY